jgi:hypothetical protein
MSFGAVVSTLELYRLEVVSAFGVDFNLLAAFLCISEDTECITKDDPDNEEPTHCGCSKLKKPPLEWICC